MESLLVERIVVHYVKLYRIQKAEAEFMKSALNPHREHVVGGIFKPYIELDGKWEPEKVVVDNKGYTPTVSSEDMERLGQVYGRYETTVENKLYKAMHELERLQRLRKGDYVAAPVAVDVAGSFGEMGASNG